jgi:hypothetical protein
MGSLRLRVMRAFIVHGGEGTTSQLREWCWPRLAGERLHRWRTRPAWLDTIKGSRLLLAP